MPFIPHTESDVTAMLATIGAPNIDALFEEIPAALRIKSLAGIPEALTEMEIGRLMQSRAQQDGRPLNFIGAGAYEHHIPAAVWAIVTRGEFYSAYTPYQAEASQGTLQLLYEYQTMMAGLTGMQVSNASLYDGASALAEACLMAVRAHRKSKSARILVPADVNPTYLQVARAVTEGQNLKFDVLPYEAKVGTTQASSAGILQRSGHHSCCHSAAELLRVARRRRCDHRLGAREQCARDRGRESALACDSESPQASGARKASTSSSVTASHWACRCRQAVRTSDS